MHGGAVPSRYPAVLARCPSVLPQHSAVPPRQPSILTPSFLSPGSLLRSASRSFHGIDPAGSGEVSRALHGISPVATAEAPVAHRRTAPLPPPKSHVSFAGFAPLRRFARCKNKKRGHPTSDALALFSNDVAPTLALTPYSRTQVPSGDRIPRLYA